MCLMLGQEREKETESGDDKSAMLVCSKRKCKWKERRQVCARDCVRQV